MTVSSPPLNAIITGASSGIGKATAFAFAEAGIRVALLGRSVERLSKVAQAIGDRGGKAQSYPLNLSQLEDIAPQLEAIAQQWGCDILVNAAGMALTRSLEKTTLADWQQVINLNLLGVGQCVAGVLPVMRDRQTGLIINLASIAAHTAFPEWGAYCVSKAGLVMYSKVLAAEERAYGIRVVCLSPGAVNTELWDTATVQANFDRKAMLTPEIIAQTILYLAQLPKEAVIEEMTLLPAAGTL
jgi:NADP-dependent 3-hydroxy acid dehydrogenase YdfG